MFSVMWGQERGKLKDSENGQQADRDRHYLAGE